MADIDSLPPGSFCWPELATTDQKAAVAFYRALFGWSVSEQPIGPTEVYSLFEMRGRHVGAACTLRAEEKGVPPHWGTYISVVDADAAAKKAQALGGKVFAGPFDVMDAGRMAVVQDPTGAVFHVWQANKNVGIRIVGEAGSLCWTELATRDTKTAAAFYAGLFGWGLKQSGADAPMEYTEFELKGQPIGGMMPMPAQIPAFVPPYWMPYFMVADVDASVAKAKSLGGTVTLEAMDIPNVGRFAIVNDPQGAMFAAFKPK